MVSYKGSLISFFGGITGQMLNEVISFNTLQRSWSMLSVQGKGPGARAGHTTTRISEAEFVLVGGGDMQMVFRDVYLFNAEQISWLAIETSGQLPPERAGHSANLCRAEDGRILILGGANADGEF